MSPEPVVSPTMRCTCPAGTLLTLHILLIESPLWVFLSGVKLVFSRGCEHFLNQLLTRPGSQTLLDWGSDRQSAHPADRITQFHFSASIFIFFFFVVKWWGLLHTSSPGKNRPLETINWHILRILKRFITCAIVQASSILKNIMSVRSGTHLKYTGSFNVCCRQQNGRPLFIPVNILLQYLEWNRTWLHSL